jgi:hypothetical protein
MPNEVVIPATATSDETYWVSVARRPDLSKILLYRLNEAEALAGVTVILDGYTFHPTEVRAWIKTCARFMQTVPRCVAVRCLSPVFGIVRDCKRVPTIADFAGWCEPHVRALEKIVVARAGIKGRFSGFATLPPPPVLTDDEKARLATKWEGLRSDVSARNAELDQAARAERARAARRRAAIERRIWPTVGGVEGWEFTDALVKLVRAQAREKPEPAECASCEPEIPF